MYKTIDGVKISVGNSPEITKIRQSILQQDDISNFSNHMFIIDDNFLKSGNGCFDLELDFIHNDDWREMLPSLIDIAQEALDRSFIPIPLKWKRPYLPRWQQTERKDAMRRVKREVNKKAANNIGVLTGEPSNLIVLDLDYKPINFEYPNTLVVETSKGYHIYFQYDDRFPENRSKINGKKIDLRSGGGQIVYPGSIHEDGTVYEKINDSDYIMEMPEDVEQFLLGERDNIYN